MFPIIIIFYLDVIPVFIDTVFIRLSAGLNFKLHEMMKKTLYAAAYNRVNTVVNKAVSAQYWS